MVSFRTIPSSVEARDRLGPSVLDIPRMVGKPVLEIKNVFTQTPEISLGAPWIRRRGINKFGDYPVV